MTPAVSVRDAISRRSSTNQLASSLLAARVPNDTSSAVPSSSIITGLSTVPAEFLSDVQEAVGGGNQTELEAVLDDFESAARAEFRGCGDVIATTARSSTITSLTSAETTASLANATVQATIVNVTAEPVLLSSTSLGGLSINSAAGKDGATTTTMVGMITRIKTVQVTATFTGLPLSSSSSSSSLLAVTGDSAYLTDLSAALRVGGFEDSGQSAESAAHRVGRHSHTAAATGGSGAASVQVPTASTASASQTSQRVETAASSFAVAVTSADKAGGVGVPAIPPGSSSGSTIALPPAADASTTAADSASPSIPATTTTAAATAASPWTSGVYSQSKSEYSGRNGIAIKDKAGIAFDSTSGTDWTAWEAIEGNAIGWGFNWSPDVSNSFPTSTWEYVPQLWGTGSDAALRAGLADDFGGIGVTTVLSLNEPDNAGQANLTPAAAAAAHQAIFTDDVAAKYIIGAPAVQFGGEQWFKEWLDACEGKCLFDFVPLHTYFTDLSTIQAYVAQFHADIGLNIWLTEVACMNWVNGAVVYCTAADQTSFTDALGKWAYETDYLERYAQFGAFQGVATTEPIALMNTDGTPNALGIAFVSTT